MKTWLWLQVLAAIAIQLAYAGLCADRELYCLFRDDAFYYFVIAKNLVNAGFSSFDGVVPTNGYHPLWLVVLWPLAAIFRGRSLLLAVIALGALSSCVSLWLLQRTVPLVVASDDGADPEPAVACGVTGGMVLVFQLSFIGLESVIAIPALLLVALLLCRLLAEERPSSVRAAMLGASLSLLCLARLDAMLLGLVVVALVAWDARRRRSPALATMAILTAVAAGWLPVVAYLAYNEVHYGHVLTTSALAKSLSRGLQFNVLATAYLLSPAVVPFVLATFAAAVFLFRLEPPPGPAARTARAARRSAAAMTVFAGAYLLLLVFTTSWGLQRWYLYPLVPCVAIGGAGTATWACARYPAVSPCLPVVARLAAMALPVTVLCTSLASRVGVPAHIVDSALLIAAFERTHPGRYAMGDAAGVPGFLMQRPPLQLEGLVADYALIEHIRRRDELGAVLREYRIDYLIDRGPSVVSGGCREVSVPAARHAGPAAPRMTGSFCNAPLELADDLRIFALHPG